MCMISFPNVLYVSRTPYDDTSTASVTGDGGRFARFDIDTPQIYPLIALQLFVLVTALSYITTTFIPNHLHIRTFLIIHHHPVDVVLSSPNSKIYEAQ